MWDKKQSQCKECFKERAFQYRKYSPCVRCRKPKEYGVPRGAKLCLKCAQTCSTCEKNPRHHHRTQCLQCVLDSNKKRNSLPENQKRNKIFRITSKYNVGREVAIELAEAKQCACCSNIFTKKAIAHVDHCHATGKVRGVLCFNCNAALGHLRDGLDRLIGLFCYLIKAKTGKRADIEKAIHCLQLLLEIDYKEAE